MKKIIGALMALVFLNGYRASDEVSALSSSDDKDLAWVFIQFNVPEEKGDAECDYLYAKISKKLLAKISGNQISQGFIYMHPVRNWGNDETIQAYRDAESTGGPDIPQRGYSAHKTGS